MQNKVVYWQDRNGQLYMGLPEQFPAPFGLEKIVCVNVLQAEFWSKRMRDQERVIDTAKSEEREMIEGPIRDNLRKHILHLASNARNNMNRDFLLKHLENYERRPNMTRTERVSYLHQEAYERGR